MRLTLNETYQKAVEAQKAEQFQYAEHLYNAILEKVSKNPEVNFNMGVLAVSISKVQEALPFFQTALEMNPNIEQYWLGYIDALIKLGQITNAILVLDEATSALDSEVEAAIQASLNRLMQGKTVIAIAHRLSTIAAMDRLVIIDEGNIIEQGSHKELLALGGIYAKLWQHQTGGFIGLD